jgi:hypothetical protein
VVDTVKAFLDVSIQDKLRFESDVVVDRFSPRGYPIMAAASGAKAI